MSTQSHLLEPWVPSPSNERYHSKKPKKSILSCLDNSILSISGNKSVVNLYEIKHNQLYSKGYIEAHHTSPFHTVCQSADAIYGGCRSGDIAIWGKSSKAWSKILAHGKPISYINATSQCSGAPLLTGSDNGSCAAHDPSTMLEIGRVSAHDEKVTWTDRWENTSYISASLDGTAALWDLRIQPKKRIVKRFNHGTGIINSLLFGQQTLCTASLVIEKYENLHLNNSKKYDKRRSVQLTFFDIRQGETIDKAKITWDNIDIDDILIQADTNDAIEGTRDNFTMLTIGKRKHETMIQGCNERGIRQFSIEPCEREITGRTFCKQGVIVASPNPKTALIELSFVPTVLHIHQENISSNNNERDRNEQRLAVSTWNKKLAVLGAKNKNVEMIELINKMHKKRIYPTSVTFEVVLRALIRNKALLLVAKVLDYMDVARTRPTNKTLIELLKLASFKRTTPFAEKLMQRLSKMGNPAVRETFIELLLIGPTKATLSIAFEMLMETIEKKLKLTRNIVCIFLQAASDRHNTDFAFQLLTAMNQRSSGNSGLQVEEYQTVACMLATIRETDKALRLLYKALDQFGLNASFDMACHLVKSFGRAGLLEKTSDVYNILLEYSDRDTEWKLGPRVHFAAAHIDAALSCAKPKIAMHVLKNLNTGKYKNHKSFNELSNSLIRFVMVLEADNLCDHQQRVISRMQEMGLDIPYDCLISLLGCLGLRKRINEAMYLFNTLRHFKHKNGEDRTNHALSVLISAVGRAGLSRHLFKLLNELFGGSGSISRRVSTNKVACIDLQVIESAVEALRCVEEPRRSVEIWKNSGMRVTRLLIHNCILCEGLMCQTQKINVMVKIMKKDGCRIDEDTYAACIIGCISGGRLDRASEWLKSFCKYQERRLLTAKINIQKWFEELNWIKQRKIEKEKIGYERKVGHAGIEGKTVEEKEGKEGKEGQEGSEGKPGQEGKPEQEGKQETTKTPTQMYSAIRTLLAKQQRLRRSSRSHPNINESILNLIERLVRSKQLESAMQCLKRVFWIRGTTDPMAATYVLEAGIKVLSNSLSSWSTSSESKPSTSNSISTSTSSTEHFTAVDLQWILYTIEPRCLPEIHSDVFGRALECVVVACTSDQGGYICKQLIQRFAINGGRLNTSIVEAMLRASEHEKKAREANGKSHLEHPLKIWGKAEEYEIHLSNRARLLFLRALVAADQLNEAIHFIKSFTDKGYRVHPMTWLLRILCQRDFTEDALWLYRIEQSRNKTIPKDIEDWLRDRKPRKEDIFRARTSLIDLIDLKKRKE